MREKQLTVTDFARSMACSRANIYKMLGKTSLDTLQLARVSQILDYDFFSLYSQYLKEKKVNPAKLKSVLNA